MVRIHAYRRRTGDVGEHERSGAMTERVKKAVQEKIGYTGTVVGGYEKKYAHYSTYNVFVKTPNRGPLETALGMIRMPPPNEYVTYFNIEIWDAPYSIKGTGRVSYEDKYKYGANALVSIDIKNG